MNKGIEVFEIAIALRFRVKIPAKHHFQILRHSGIMSN